MIKMSINSNKNNIKKIIILAILLSMAIILGYIDKLLPFKFYMLDIKVGLANIITIITLFIFDKKSAFIIGLLRVIILSLLFINVYNFIISLAAFIISIMFLFISYSFLYDNNINSYDYRIVIMSIISAFFHNMTQIFVVRYITNTTIVYNLITFFAVISIITGILIGIIAMLLIKRIKYIKNIDNFN